MWILKFYVPISTAKSCSIEGNFTTLYRFQATNITGHNCDNEQCDITYMKFMTLGLHTTSRKYAVTPSGKVWKAVYSTWPRLIPELQMHTVHMNITAGRFHVALSEYDKESEGYVHQGARVGDQRTKIHRLWRKKRDEIRRCPRTPWHGHCSNDVSQHAPARSHTWSFTN